MSKYFKSELDTQDLEYVQILLRYDRLNKASGRLLDRLCNGMQPVERLTFNLRNTITACRMAAAAEKCEYLLRGEKLLLADITFRLTGSEARDCVRVAEMLLNVYERQLLAEAMHKMFKEAHHYIQPRSEG